MRDPRLAPDDEKRDLDVTERENIARSRPRIGSVFISASIFFIFLSAIVFHHHLHLQARNEREKGRFFTWMRRIERGQFQIQTFENLTAVHFLESCVQLWNLLKKVSWKFQVSSGPLSTDCTWLLVWRQISSSKWEHVVMPRVVVPRVVVPQVVVPHNGIAGL